MRNPSRSAFVLAALLGTVASYSAPAFSAGCDPKTNTKACVTQTCDKVGETTIDAGYHNLIVCLKDDTDPSKLIWKSMIANNGNPSGGGLMRTKSGSIPWSLVGGFSMIFNGSFNTCSFWGDVKHTDKKIKVYNVNNGQIGPTGGQVGDCGSTQEGCTVTQTNCSCRAGAYTEQIYKSGEGQVGYVPELLCYEQ